MSAERTRRYPAFTRITCDWHDGKGDHGPGGYFDASDAATGRRVGREMGWVRRDGRDYCPRHAALIVRGGTP